MFDQIHDVLRLSGGALLKLFPYVLLGVAIGDLLKLSSWTRLISRGCAKSLRLSIVTAALLGSVSPLCTYGTLPIVLQLFKQGFPLAPLITFLSVSSLMNPQLFLITWGGIGLEMALARAGAALLFGITLGLVLQHFPVEAAANPNVFQNSPSVKETPISPSEPRTWRSYLQASWNSLQFVGFYIVLGIILGSMVEVFVPGRVILAAFSSENWYSVLLAALLGVPLYACGGGSIPLIRSLILGGMSQGAALAFFVVGPATRVTPLLALSAVLRPKFLAAYVASLVGYALLAGTIYH